MTLLPEQDSTPVYTVELVGAVPIRRRGIAYPQIPRIFHLTMLGGTVERAICFKHGQGFIESYEVIPTEIPGYYKAWYLGLRRSRELARKFNPARLPN